MLHENRMGSATLAVALACCAIARPASAQESTSEEGAVSEKQAPAQPVDEPAQPEGWGPNKKPPARYGVAVNPIGLLFGLVIGEFDYGLNDRLSLNVNGSYWDLDVLVYETTAWGLGIGAQYFPAELGESGPLYQGFYVYPSLQVVSVTVDEPLLGEASWVSVAPQAVVGYQWDWRPLTVRIGAGGAYYVGSVADGYQTDLDGFRFVLDGTVGLTFGG